MSQLNEAEEKGALRDLINSEGWALFTRMAREVHGDEACMQRIDQQIALIEPADRENQRESIRTIRAESRAVLALLEWPAHRIAELDQSKAPGFFGRRRVGA